MKITKILPSGTELEFSLTENNIGIIEVINGDLTGSKIELKSMEFDESEGDQDILRVEYETKDERKDLVMKIIEEFVLTIINDTLNENVQYL